MRVTEKGQVTIPKHIRDQLGIEAGSEVDFVDDNGRVRLVKAGPEAAAAQRAQRMRMWIDRVKGKANAGLTTDEIMAMTRDGNGSSD